MRNDSDRWDRALTIDYQGSGLSIREVGPPSLHYISGAKVLSLYREQLVEWPTIAGEGPIALVLRRDRVLFVGQTCLSTGYHHEKGLAVSNVTSKYVSLEAEGLQAMKFVSALCGLRIEHPSRSAIRTIFGEPVSVYRYRNANVLRLLIQRAAVPSLTKRLEMELSASYQTIVSDLAKDPLFGTS